MHTEEGGGGVRLDIFQGNLPVQFEISCPFYWYTSISLFHWLIPLGSLWLQFIFRWPSHPQVYIYKKYPLPPDNLWKWNNPKTFKHKFFHYNDEYKLLYFVSCFCVCACMYVCLHRSIMCICISGEAACPTGMWCALHRCLVRSCPQCSGTTATDTAEYTHFVSKISLVTCHYVITLMSNRQCDFSHISALWWKLIIIIITGNSSDRQQWILMICDYIVNCTCWPCSQVPKITNLFPYAEGIGWFWTVTSGLAV